MTLERSTQFNKISQSDTSLNRNILQRKCDCGQHTHGGGMCAVCSNEKIRQSLQGKFQIGEANDKYEQEADRIAATVVQHWDDSVISQKNTEGQSQTLDSILQVGQTLSNYNAGERIQRQVCSIGGEDLPLEPEEVDEETSQQSEEESPVISEVKQGILQGRFSSSQRKVQRKSSTVAPVQGQTNILPGLGRNSGRPLPEGIRKNMETRMGADFSSVRIHTNSDAEKTSQAIGARAFTYGRDIVFNRGEFNSDSRNGKQLLAHELTHTLQQNGNTIRRLAISSVGSLMRGACGMYSKRWDFTLGAAAPAAGYIVQQIDYYENIVDCPQMGQCTANPNFIFWEAWPVKQGDTLHELHGSSGYTDQASHPGGPTKVGFLAAIGEIKFYLRSVTGDLGGFNTAPSSPSGGWSPNAAGVSGSLPSTLSKPSWWSTAPTEGPGTRGAWSSWRCCNNSRDFNSIHANP